MTVHSKTQSQLALKGGIVAGIVAGLALWLVLSVMTVMMGGDVWMSMKGSAAPFIGARAQQPGFDALAVILGRTIHMLISIGWGVSFALLFFGLSKPATVLVGAIWGVVVWLGMYYVVLPLVGLSQIVRAAPVGMAVALHVMFGVVLGVSFLPFQRELPRGAMPGGMARPST